MNTLNRRQFLKLAGAISALAAFPRAVGAATTAPRVVVVGGGFGGLHQQNRKSHQLHGLLIQRIRRQRRDAPILQRRYQIGIDAHAEF